MCTSHSGDVFRRLSECRDISHIDLDTCIICKIYTVVYYVPMFSSRASTIITLGAVARRRRRARAGNVDATAADRVRTSRSPIARDVFAREVALSHTQYAHISFGTPRAHHG
jgi:hypothetical protein